MIARALEVPVGFDTDVISGTTDALRNTYALSPFSLGFTVAGAIFLFLGDDGGAV